MIDRRWIDVDLQPPEGMGVDGFAGMLPPDDCLMACADSGNFNDAFDLIPRSEWPVLIAAQGDVTRLDPYIRNQGKEGSCVGNGTAASVDRCQAIQHGCIIRTSAMSLYKRIGRSAGSGANVGDALTELKTRGILPEDTPENRAMFDHVHPATGFGHRLPDGWETTGAQFRVEEFWKISCFDEAATALFLNFGVVYGRARHCICGWQIVKDRGNWLLKFKNSWYRNGQPWGENGFGYDSESYLRGGPSYGFAIRTITPRVKNGRVDRVRGGRGGTAGSQG